MKREVIYKDTKIEYELERKKVKNINLRIKPDLTVYVSANRRVSKKYIDSFVLKKADFILNALEKYRSHTFITEPKYTNEDFTDFINSEFLRIYDLFQEYRIIKPTLKLRKMKSRWGSCNYVKGIITLNTNLVYCSKEQISYVIVHEFSHLLVHNHSKEFYKVVETYIPDYKRIRKEMNKINLR